MRQIAAFLLICLLSPVLSLSQEAKADTRQDPPPDYKSDGCSLFPDGDYRDCCVAHDREYYRGGTNAERKAADKRLYECVRGKGHKYLSRMMWLGVRIGGIGFLPTPFRWGFGQSKTKKKN